MIIFVLRFFFTLLLEDVFSFSLHLSFKKKNFFNRFFFSGINKLRNEMYQLAQGQRFISSGCIRYLRFRRGKKGRKKKVLFFGAVNISHLAALQSRPWFICRRSVKRDWGTAIPHTQARESIIWGSRMLNVPQHTAESMRETFKEPCY